MRAELRPALLVVALVHLSWSCGGSPGSPSSNSQLPFGSETAATRYYYESGDTVHVARQEAFNAWAVERLSVSVPQKVEYRKYFSRESMAKYTGRNNTNGFAEPERFTLHTIWPFDNHEIVHVYTALVGRPSDFFNEGIAVSFQTEPSTNDFTVRFNGMQVHEACRAYQRAGTLPLPVSRYVTTNEFRGIPDQVLSYRFAGSFVLFLEERLGLPRVLSFMRASGRDDSFSVIRTRFEQAFRITLEAAEAQWLAMLSDAG